MCFDGKIYTLISIKLEMIDMKRVLSVVLVVMMIFALAVSASALKSPGQKDYYKIEVGSEGKGHAEKSADKVEIGTDGTVTFTAIEDGGFFTKWIIDGKYTVVSGSEYDDVLVIKPESDILAVASFSEEKDYLNVYAKPEPPEYGEATADPARIKKGSDGTSTLTATEKNGSTFQEWKLECEYDIVSGDLKSKVLVIRPKTDVYATAYFTKPGEEPTEPSTPDKKDEDKPSPKTGYPLFFVFGIMGLALIAGVVATKKIKG